MGRNPHDENWFHAGRKCKSDSVDAGGLFDEIVLVDFLHFVRVRDPHAEPVPDLQIREFGAVDEHDPLGDPGDEVVGRRGKIGRGDEHALGRPVSLEAADEVTNLAQRDAIVRVEALGLDIDDIQAEFVSLIMPSTPPSPTRPRDRPIS